MYFGKIVLLFQERVLKMNRPKKIFIGVVSIGFALIFNVLFLNICITKYNFIEMIIRSFLAVAVSVGVLFLLRKISGSLEKHWIKIIIIFMLLMLTLQIVFGYLLEIKPNWDFMYVYQGPINWAKTGSFSQFQRYYYMYPNNIGPMTFFMIIFKAAGLFGIRSYYMVATIINAILNVLMMFIVFLICKRLFSVKAGIFSLYIFAVSIPSYFGAAVFYTDVLTMIFPVLFYYLYLRLRDSESVRNQIIYSLLMGATALLGMELKFTVIIVTIAVFIDMIMNCNIKKIAISVITVVAIVCVGMISFKAYIYNSGNLDKKTAELKNFPATHWIMMGLNGDGGFNQLDEDYTNGFDTVEHRNEAIKNQIKRRLSDMGGIGLYQLIIRKSTKCFSDGTYELNAFFSHGMARNTILNKYIVGDGKYYEQYKTFCTGIFLCFQLLMIFSAFYSFYNVIIKQKDTVANLVPMLSVLGIFLFLLMWETSARYIVNYIPMIYICATDGVEKFVNIIN